MPIVRALGCLGGGMAMPGIYTLGSRKLMPGIISMDFNGFPPPHDSVRHTRVTSLGARICMPIVRALGCLGGGWRCQGSTH